MKRVLMIATTGNFLTAFEISDLNILKKMGYEIHCAANFMGMNEPRKYMLEKVESINHQVDFSRSPYSSNNIRAYFQINKLLENTYFDIIHCHTPIGAAIGRMAANKYRKAGTKVVYTCHGYHFHKESNKKQWMVYYPIEKMLAHYTDMLITINKEDYELSKTFKVPEVRYIPGVGIETKKIDSIKCSKKDLLAVYGIPKGAFVVLTIGELSERKNQEVIIRALSEIRDENIYYLICGNGKKEEEYKKLAKDLEIDNKVIFAGYVDHDTVLQLCHAIDIGAIPSKIEGLGLAGLEILASGHPLIGSNIHGIKDYLIDGETGIGVAPEDVKGFANAIKRMKNDPILYHRLAGNSQKMAARFDIEISRHLMKNIYVYIEHM